MARIFAYNNVINIHLETTVDGLPRDKEQQDSSQVSGAGAFRQIACAVTFHFRIGFLTETHAIILFANKNMFLPSFV